MMALVFGGIVFAPSGARAESGCTTRLMDCYTAAAKIDDFWYRTAAGIDCEIDYAGCVRDKLFEG
jgi:hypothetical protein